MNTAREKKKEKKEKYSRLARNCCAVNIGPHSNWNASDFDVAGVWGYTVQINGFYDFPDITEPTLFFERETCNMRRSDASHSE